MTESQLRQNVANTANGYVGCREGDSTYAAIIKKYNDIKGKGDYTMTARDAWCATFASVVGNEAGCGSIIPVNCSCEQMINEFKALGSWNEDGRITPDIADYCFYNWDDGTQPNDGWSDHVGIVTGLSGRTITVTEGNYSDAVKKRNITVGWGYIRGYGQPKYSRLASSSKDLSPSADADGKKNDAGGIKVGDVVNFIGNKHFASSHTGAKGTSCNPGKAKVTAVNKSGAHPYHLVAVSGKGSTVYGWVDASAIKGAGSTKSSSIKVGDTVKYSGNKHYTSSYKGAKSSSCKGGTAKVTKINKSGTHPYHLVHSGSGCTVNGWVNADLVTKA